MVFEGSTSEQSAETLGKLKEGSRWRIENLRLKERSASRVECDYFKAKFRLLDENDMYLKELLR